MILCTRYLCGPTVHDEPHLGNYKTLYNSIKDYFNTRKKGQRLMMNLTDFDQKIFSKIGSYDLEQAKRYTNLVIIRVLRTLSRLGIPIHKIKIVRCTDHLQDMLSLVKKLIKQNLTQKRQEGIYWREHPGFCLWKTPGFFNGGSLGSGQVGWHTECGALINKYCTPHLIHYGGVDLKMHHENQQLQNPSKKIQWRRSRAVLVNNQKMSKSKGNVFNVKIPSDKSIIRFFYRYLLDSWPLTKQIKISELTFNDTYKKWLTHLTLSNFLTPSKKVLKLNRYRLRYKRKNKYYISDRIRKLIESQGYTVQDQPEKTILVKKCLQKIPNLGKDL